MSKTIYSHAFRILSCQSCGAPLEASVEGGQTSCAYCNAVLVVDRRDEDSDQERASAGAGVSESERIALLRAQGQQATPMPPTVSRLLEGGRLRASKVPEARAEWKALRSQLPRLRSAPLEEKFFYLTLVLAPAEPARERRALLETAVELLPDRGHRQVLRCRLAFLAACALDVEAAGEWLKPCDPRPTHLASLCWSARPGHGTSLVCEFGEPYLDVHESRADTRRRVHVHGAWHLWVTSRWEVVQEAERLGGSGTPEKMAEAASALRGQRISRLQIRRSRWVLALDRGGELHFSPARPLLSDDESWCLFEPSGGVITVRGTSTYKYLDADAPDDRGRWVDVHGKW